MLKTHKKMYYIKAGMVCAGFSVNLESHIYKEKGKGKRNAQNN